MQPEKLRLYTSHLDYDILNPKSKDLKPEILNPKP